jgi:hypothetical protein
MSTRAGESKGKSDPGVIVSIVMGTDVFTKEGDTQPPSSSFDLPGLRFLVAFFDEGFLSSNLLVVAGVFAPFFTAPFFTALFLGAAFFAAAFFVTPFFISDLPKE